MWEGHDKSRINKYILCPFWFGMCSRKRHRWSQSVSFVSVAHVHPLANRKPVLHHSDWMFASNSGLGTNNVTCQQKLKKLFAIFPICNKAEESHYEESTWKCNRKCILCHYVWPHSEYCVQFSSTYLEKTIVELEKVQQRAPKMIRDWSSFPVMKGQRVWDFSV